MNSPANGHVLFIDLNTIRFESRLKPLHGHPRFDALLEKIAPTRVRASLVRENIKPK